MSSSSVLEEIIPTTTLAIYFVLVFFLLYVNAS